MGNQASNAVKKADETREIVEESSGEGGQKIRAVVDTPVPQAVSEDSSLDLDETDSETDSDSDLESDDEEDEELMERLRILEDARQLKQLAVAFLHPELPVEVDSTATARCYFDRASAPEQETLEEADYRQMVLADAAALKKLAVDYMHPELGVVTTDPSATARCYFDRASAPEQESLEEAEERRMVLADAAALKKLAIDYMHPELGVVTTDPSATARCYFDRASAPEQESVEYSEERRFVLVDAAALKKLAVDYKKTKFVQTPVVKHVGTKTLATQMEGGIKKSASRVELYGLDHEHGDDFY